MYSYQVFAAVTADSRLQIWDISVSDIDPVISLDTNLDVEDASAVEAIAADTAVAGGASSRKSGAAAQGSRREYGSHRDANREDDKETPVTRLLKNLANGSTTRRTLTAVTFSENSPVAVVGDSTGVVTVYRVNDPLTITEEGNPAAQTAKLKEAVWRQADPSDAAKLQHSNASAVGDVGSGASDKQVAVKEVAPDTEASLATTEDAPA